jgi:hypothetical protein
MGLAKVTFIKSVKVRRCGLCGCVAACYIKPMVVCVLCAVQSFSCKIVRGIVFVFVVSSSNVIRVYVCTYVCMYVRMYACMYVCMWHVDVIWFTLGFRMRKNVDYFSKRVAYY